MRSLSNAILGAALALLLLPLSASAEKPNILFLFADDQAFSTIQELGNERIETPNLDRLVRSGTTFTHAYNMGSWSGAVCVASRAMLNSGKFLWRAHKTDLPAAAEEKVLWSQLMEQAGYDTYFTGKWHVKADAAKIFGTAEHIRPGMPQQTPEGYNRPIDGQPDSWDPSDSTFGGFWEGGTHWTEITANDALSFLQSASESERPFFSYVAFNAPHDPRQSPKEFVDRYPLDSLSLPTNFLSEYPFNEAMKSGRKLRDEKLAPFPRTKNAVLTNLQEYYAIITHMDHHLGRILDALEASGKKDSTYLFFSADHGLACGEHGLMGKQNMFDHSLRVPLIAVGPGVSSGARNKSPVYLQDIMATALDLAGAPRPEHVEFQSLLPALRDPKANVGYEDIYGAYLDAQRAIIHDHKKLIIYPKVPTAILYDLKADPQETNNLAHHPKHLSTVKSLFQRLLALQKNMDD
ncbi:MAG: sulfatase-like hydrolase/transferase, partial [Verrucomicrobiota bacterium]